MQPKEGGLRLRFNAGIKKDNIGYFTGDSVKGSQGSAIIVRDICCCLVDNSEGKL